jgi:hypothetical protein
VDWSLNQGDYASEVRIGSFAKECHHRPMRIAKPLLLVTTPVGVAWGLYEGWRLAGGLVFLMAALIGLIGVALGSVVLTIRRERRQEQLDLEARQHAPKQ